MYEIINAFHIDNDLNHMIWFGLLLMVFMELSG
jgi:hypothetical protein